MKLRASLIGLFFFLSPAIGVGAVCGDGILDSGEACDDGNGVTGDGCTSMCQVEPGFTCNDPTPAQSINGVPDGGFESGTPNAVWSEASTNFGTPICSVANCGSISGTVGPNSGTWFAWFGGSSSTEFGSIEQDLVIEASDSILTVAVSLPRCDKPADFARVLIDGNEVFKVTASDPECAVFSYRTVGIDLETAPGGPYNDGLSHTLRAESEVYGTDIFSSNFLFDDFMLDRSVPAQPGVCDRLSVGLLTLPDLNGNGSPEIAVLLKMNGFLVQIRDAETGSLVRAIDFGDDPVSSMLTIDDIDGNGHPEIALLGTRPDNNVRVQVKDSATGAVVNNIFYGSNYSASHMAVLPDTNANNADELLVVGVDSAGGVRAQARDALSDAATSTTFYGNRAPPLDAVVIPDVSGNGEPEVLVHGQVLLSGQARAQQRDTGTKSLLRNIFFGTNYSPLELVVVNDVSGDGVPDLAQLGWRADTGGVRIQIKRTDTGGTVATAFTGSVDSPVALLGIGDANGNTVDDVALLVERPDESSKIVIRDGGTGEFVSNIFASIVSNPIAMAIVPDMNGSGDPEIAVLGDGNAGKRRVQIKDSISGAQINVIDFSIFEMLDESAFNASVVSPVLIDFEGLVAPGGFLYLGNPGIFSGDDVTITSNSPMFVQNNNLYGTGAFLSPQQSNPEIVDIVLPAGVMALGFSYQSASGSVQVNGAETFDIPAVAAGNLEFFGIIGGAAIESVTITIAGPGIDIDNVIFATELAGGP